MKPSPWKLNCIYYEYQKGLHPELIFSRSGMVKTNY